MNARCSDQRNLVIIIMRNQLIRR